MKRKNIEYTQNCELPFLPLEKINSLNENIRLEKKNLIKIAIAADENTTYLTKFLPLFLSNRNINAKITELSFGSFEYLKNDLKNKFWSKDYDFYIIIPSSKKLMLNDDINLKLNKEIINQEIIKWKKLWAVINKPAIQLTYNPVFFSKLGLQDSLLTNGYQNFIDRINYLLIDIAPGNIHFINTDQLIKQNSVCDFNDHKLYYLAKQSFNMESIPFIANAISSIISGVLGGQSKLIITDFDNTLWGGTIGDVGYKNIIVNNETPEGESFLSFQRYLKTLTEQGIILAGCSKNNEAIAMTAFKNKNMILSKEDFALLKINFNNKAKNINEILKELNILPNSAIFLDDSKIECDLVKKSFPEMRVIHLGDDSSLFIKKIDNFYPFFFQNLTKEDERRNISYKKISDLKKESKKFDNIENFLESLETKVTIEVLDNSNIERCYQLLVKTNQFKLNKKIFSLNEIKKQKNYMILSLKDKMQDYGIISFLIYNINKKKKEIEILNWVLSCRVFSRKVENFILHYFYRKLKKESLEKIKFKFQKTGKNIYLQNFIKEMKLSLKKNYYSVYPNNKIISSQETLLQKIFKS
jgi:FkbH-like protein